MKIQNESEFKNADKKLNLKRISGDEIEIVDVDDIWDGPLSGDCFWKQRKYYFQCFDQVNEEDSDRWPRKYLLINLNKDQIDSKEKLRDTFLKWRSGSISEENYLQYLKKIPMQNIAINQIVGWFDSDFKDGNKPARFIESYFVWQKKGAQKFSNYVDSF